MRGRWEIDNYCRGVRAERGAGGAKGLSGNSDAPPRERG